MVLLQSTTLTVKDPAFRAAVKDVQKTLAAYPEVTKLRRRSAPAARDSSRPTGARR